MKLQAEVWHGQDKFEEARSEALGAVDLFQKLGAANRVEGTRELLLRIDGDAQANGRSYHPS